MNFDEPCCVRLSEEGIHRACVQPSVGLPDAPAVISALTSETMPTVALLQLGYNDSPATFSADIDQVVSALNARAVQRVVFVNLSTRRASVNYTASNDALIAATQRYPNVSVLDWNTYSAGPDKSRWFSDSVHLTSTGRVEFTLFLRNQLDELRRRHLRDDGGRRPAHPPQPAAAQRPRAAGAAARDAAGVDQV